MTLKLENMKGEISVVGNNLTVKAESHFQAPFFIKVDPKELKRRKTPIIIGVYEGNKRIKTAKATFLGPGASTHGETHSEEDLKVEQQP